MLRHLKLLGEILIKFFLVFAIYIAVGIVIFNTLPALKEESLLTWAKMIEMLPMIAAVFIVYRFLDKKKPDLGIHQTHRLFHFAEGLGYGAVLMTCTVLLIYLFGGFDILAVQFDPQVLGQLGLGFVMFTIVSTAEELFIRGYLQGLIRQGYGTAAALWMPSVIFSSIHLGNGHILENPIPLIGLFGAGVLLSYAREASGGLYLPIGLHITWNVFQSFVYGFAVSGNAGLSAIMTIQPKGNELISGGAFGTEGSVFSLIVMALFILYFHVRKKNS